MLSLVIMKKALTPSKVILYAGIVCLALFSLLVRMPSSDGSSTYTPLELSRDIGVLRDMAEGRPPLTGPPTVHGGFRFGPAYYYISFPFAYLTGFRPYSLALTSLAFSLASLVLVWYLCRLWYPERPAVAWLAVALASVSSLDIQFAKYGSNPNTLGFFGLLLLLSVCLYGRRRRRLPYAALAGLAFGIGIQLHLVAAVAMSVFLLVALSTSLVRPDRRAVAAFVAASLSVNLPYLWGICASGFADVAGLGHIAASAPLYGNWATRLRDLAGFWISIVFNVHHLFSLIDLVGWNTLAVLYGNIIALVGVYLLDRPRRGEVPGLPAGRLGVLTLWMIVINLTLIYPWGSVSQLFIYYFVLAIPGILMLAAVGLCRLWDSGRRATAAGVLVSYCAWQVYQIVLYHQIYPSAVSGLLFGS